MISKIKQWGNSLAIRVPKDLVKNAMLIEGSEVIISLENKKIVITKVIKKEETLEKLVLKITPLNKHQFMIPENDFKGKEIW